MNLLTQASCGDCLLLLLFPKLVLLCFCFTKQVFVASIGCPRYESKLWRRLTFGFTSCFLSKGHIRLCRSFLRLYHR